MSRINNQFSIGVHIMTALGDHDGEKVTSSMLTDSVGAHESLVRQILSKLVKAGLANATRGRNGYSSIAKSANKICLLDIYKAVETPSVFSIHDYPIEKTCRISCSHKNALAGILKDTQADFESSLKRRLLSEMVEKARQYR